MVHYPLQGCGITETHHIQYSELEHPWTNQCSILEFMSFVYLSNWAETYKCFLMLKKFSETKVLVPSSAIGTKWYYRLFILLVFGHLLFSKKRKGVCMKSYSFNSFYTGLRRRNKKQVVFVSRGKKLNTLTLL